MSNRLFFSVVLALSFFACSVLADKKDEKLSLVENKKVQITKWDSEGFTVTTNMTLDEAAEAFGTPSRDEIKKGFEDELKKEKKRSFWSGVYHTIFVVLPGIFC